nr:protein transport protein SFT2-like [Ipomoea batatas]GMC77006.1 protein transport protein SFT2-like [Ipomoea batatas]
MEFRFPSSHGETKKSPSLLADWNAYAAAKDDEASSSLGFDLEAAVRTANDKVTGTFGVVSKGVRDLPGNFQSATSTVPSGKALTYFGLFLSAGVFFIFIAFTMFLPVMVIMPQKFAICFTIGCAFIIGSFFALKGPKNQLSHMLSKELYSLCALLRGAGSCSSILCYLLLPGRIDWNEIPLFHPRIFNTKMFRKRKILPSFRDRNVDQTNDAKHIKVVTGLCYLTFDPARLNLWLSMLARQL